MKGLHLGLGMLTLTLAATGASAQALPAAASPSFCYGNVVTAVQWGYQSQQGFYGISKEGVIADEAVWQNSGLSGSAGVMIHDRYYLASSMSFGSMVWGASITVWDAKKQEKIETKNLPTVGQNVIVSFAFDRINDVAYALTRDSRVTGYQICRFDFDRLENTPVCPLVNKTYVACAIDDAGTLYVIDNAGKVESIDLTDGTATAVAGTGLTNGGLQSAFWSSRDKRIVWAMTNGQASKLVSIDPATSTSTSVAMSDVVTVIGLYTTEGAGTDMAPVVCGDLAVEYATPGDLTGKVTGTAPSVTADGSALSGTLTAYVTADGGEAETFSVSAGQRFTRDVTFETEGLHRVAVSFASGDDRGETASTVTFAGLDTPLPVGNLAYTLGDDGLVTLTWDVPEGVNGQAMGALSYEVAQNGAVVATVTENRYSTTLSGDLSLYQYSVTPVAGGKRGETTTTAKFSFGNPVKLPYTQAFETADDFVYLKVVDGNNDGNTWVYNQYYKTAKYQVNTSLKTDADDYLFMPRMELTAGNIYSISFEVYKGRVNDAEKLNVELLSYADRNNPSAATVLKTVDDITGSSYDRQTVDFTFTPDRSGVYYVGLHCLSPATAWNVEVTDFHMANLGNAGAPKAIADLAVTADETGKLEANISFTTPTVNYSDEPITSIDKVEILRNGEVIKTFDNPATGTKLEYVDRSATRPAFYDYTVRAFNSFGPGVETSVNLYVGSFIPPVSLSMDTAADFDKMSVLDTGNDGFTWHYDADGKMVCYQVEEGALNDFDILYLPMMKLETGKTYKFKFDAKSMSPKTEILFVDLCSTMDGKGAQRLYPALVIRTEDFVTFDKYFQVPETGFYTLGISTESLSTDLGSGLAFRNISVAEGPNVKAPAEVHDISATPDAEGKLEAHLTFTLPTMSLEGNSLSGKLGAVIYNPADTKVCETEAIYEPGDVVDIDVPMLQGINNVTIVASNEYGEGEKQTWGVYCGDDIPQFVSNVQAWPKEDNLGATLTWLAPAKGTYNEYYDKSTLSYNIYRYNKEIEEMTLLGNTKENKFDVSATDDPNVQSIYTYSVNPKTDFGEYKTPTTVDIAMGKPYTVPFFETNAGGSSKTGPWNPRIITPHARWAVLSEIPAFDATDNDGGFFVHLNDYRHMGDADLYSPTLDLSGTTAPFLEFKLWGYSLAKAIVKVDVATDGNNYSTLETFGADALPSSGRNGWVTYRVPLNRYKKSTVSIRFSTIIGNDEDLIIDDILVADNKGADLTVSELYSNAVNVDAGKTVTFKAAVENYSKKENAFKLQYFRNGELIGESDEMTVRSNSSKNCSFVYTTTAADAGNEVQISAKVVCDDDCVPENDMTTATIMVDDTDLAGVTDLTATADGADVTLTWSEPLHAESGVVVDTFDDYPSFEIGNFGGYTVIDGDKQPTVSINTIRYPNQYEPQAFMVFNPTAAGIRFGDNPEWAPHSGNKVLVCWSSGAYEAGSVIENDDWLISPLVEGGTEVSVWAKLVNPYIFDTFTFMYSTTTDDIDAFMPVGEEITVESMDWTEIKAQLPANARYFAIHHAKTGVGAALLFDDLTYTKASGDDMTLRGYALTRNGAHLADVLDGGEYRDAALADGTYKYCLEAVYKEGRSAASNEAVVTITGTGVSRVGSDASAVNVSGGIGRIIIRSAVDGNVRIYSVEGQTVYAGEIAAGISTVDVASGVYIVKAADSKPVKVIVR